MTELFSDVIINWNNIFNADYFYTGFLMGDVSERNNKAN